MRVILVATVLSVVLQLLPAASLANENQPDKVRDIIAETAEKLSNEDLSPDEKADAINRLRALLNRQTPRRDRADASPNDRQVREREMDRPRRGEGLERRGEGLEQRGEQPDRRNVGPRDQRDTWPLESPRLSDRSRGNFPFMQPPRFAPPRFAIGLSFLPQKRDTGEGLVVDRVMERSPAETAGLRKNDVVIAANDRELRDPQQLAEMVQNAGRWGRDLQLKVRREDEMLDLPLQPRLSPDQSFPQDFGSISAWEMMPGQPPVLRNELPPGAMPLAMGQLEREMEQLRRRMETLQRQIDGLRDQVNNRGETSPLRQRDEPRKSAEPQPDPTAEGI